MFSKELESLIQATLEDGVLEDNEKAALVKRAQKEGVDLDELEIYIKSIMQRRQRELNEKNNALEAEYEQQKKEAIGPVCPKCGKQVPSMTLKCDCGYEFIKQNSSSAVQILSDKIEEINSKPLSSSSSERDEELKNRNSQIIDLISVFPVPNTKEDIIEFLSLAAPNSKFKGGMWGTLIGRLKIFAILAVIGFIISLFLCILVVAVTKDENNAGAVFGVWITIAFIVGVVFFEADQDTIRYNKRAEAWKKKFDQVIMKGRSLRGDSEFSRQLNYYENMLKKK